MRLYIAVIVFYLDDYIEVAYINLIMNRTAAWKLSSYIPFAFLLKILIFVGESLLIIGFDYVGFLISKQVKIDVRVLFILFKKSIENAIEKEGVDLDNWVF